MEFVTQIYEKLKSFPTEEKFGLVSQIQRCAVSIPANIAEEAARKNTKEYLQFPCVARGSLSEIETRL